MLLAVLDGPSYRTIRPQLTPYKLAEYGARARTGEHLGTAGGEAPALEPTDWDALAMVLPLVLQSYDDGDFHAATGFWLADAREYLERGRQLHRAATIRGA